MMLCADDARDGAVGVNALVIADRGCVKYEKSKYYVFMFGNVFGLCFVGCMNLLRKSDNKTMDNKTLNYKDNFTDCAYRLLLVDWIEK